VHLDAEPRPTVAVRRVLPATAVVTEQTDWQERGTHRFSGRATSVLGVKLRLQHDNCLNDAAEPGDTRARTRQLTS